MARSNSRRVEIGNREGATQAGGALSTGLTSPDFHLPFFHYLTIPKNTAIASYASYELTLPTGRVNKIWVEFPKGCAGLVGFQMWRGEQQIFPLPSGIWLRSDNAVMNFQLTHYIDTVPYEVDLRGYNLDDTYPHTIWIGLEMSGAPSEVSAQMQSFLDTLRQ